MDNKNEEYINFEEKNEFFNHTDNIDEDYEEIPIEEQNYQTADNSFPQGFNQGFQNGINPNASNLARGINNNKKNKNNNIEDNKKNQDNNKNNNLENNNTKNGKINPLPSGVNNIGSNKNNDIKSSKNNSDNSKKTLNGNNTSKFGLGNIGNKEKENSELSSNITNVAATGFNVILKKLLANPYVLSVVLGILMFFIVIMVILLVISASDSDFYAYGSSYCTGKGYDLSVLDSNPPSYTYTDVFNIEWSTSSNQYNVLSTLKTHADKDGFLRSGDAYLIALGSYFGIEGEDGKKKLVMGTKYSIKLKNGVEFIGILVDAKSDAHTTASSQHAQHTIDKSVIEFEMACGDVINPVAYGFNFSGSYDKSCSKAASAINEKFYGEIESIKLVEDDAKCNYNGLFRPRNTSIYTDSKALEEIRRLAPGVEGNYAIGLRYECVTYAKLRGSEILITNTVLSEEKTKKALKEFSDSQGNGWEWTAKDNPGLKNFSFDSKCEDFRAGSVITFNGSGAFCDDGPSGYCGHVAIIEAVDLKNKKVVISDGYNSLRGQWHAVTYSFDDAKAQYGGCRGITHLLDYRG